MKFRQYLQLITGPDGFFPTPNLRRIIRRNERPTSREEAIAAKVIEEADPRHNITGRHPWDKEEQLVLQQCWFREQDNSYEWRDVPIDGAEQLFTTTEDGLPIPNAVKEPGTVPMDLEQRLRDIL